jgi:hypothetical protein
MIKKYRKIPVVVIEALTFDDLVEYGKLQPEVNIVNGMPWSFMFHAPYFNDKNMLEIKSHRITHENDDCYLIPTLEGTMKFTRADMLIIGIKGEIYPCKKEIFEQTYEEVASWSKDEMGG